MNAFLSPTPPTDALPVSIQHDSAAVGDGRRVDVTGVGGVRRDTFAALDPDLTFDYFQAQGRLMREQAAGGEHQDSWVDFRGKTWRITTMRGRLKFKIPCHAALRAHVFHRDGYRCVRCGAQAVNVPADYDGRSTLHTNTTVCSGWPDVLILDHVLTLKAGGRNVIENLQTLCETCNKRKQREDRAATSDYLGATCA